MFDRKKYEIPYRHAYPTKHPIASSIPLPSFCTVALSLCISRQPPVLTMDQDKEYDVKNDSYKIAGSPVHGQSARLYADILNDPELEGLTLYEKKALLVNRELNSHGMGKYQWWIFFLCGFGYFLDLMWAQAFGLVATPLENELGFPGQCPTELSFQKSPNN